MEKENAIMILPGDKVTFVAGRPLWLYYRIEEIEKGSRQVEIEL